MMIAAALIAVAPLGAQPAPQRATVVVDTAAVEAAFLAELRDTRSPGASLAIVSGDRVIFRRAAGVASVEARDPVTPETLFRIGSTTKMFTGLTALMLERDGRVKLEAPIATYARDLSPAISGVTLDQLLTHRAGLINEGAASGPHDDAALGVRVRGWGAEHVFAPPSDVYSYSGPGYWLAGYAIEQAAGGWFADVVAERVLAPLGMTRSTFRPLVAMTYPVAQDHRVTTAATTIIRPFPDDVTTWASGSLFSSADELARLVIALMNDGVVDGRTVLPRDVVAAMLGPRTTTPDSACGYSYGLSICRRGGTRTVSHAGFRVGSGSIIVLDPDRRLGVIVLANRNGGIFGRTASAVMESGAPSQTPSPAGGTAAAAPSPATVTGTYVNGPDTLRLRLDRDTLSYQYREQISRARIDASGSILILDVGGRPVQRFTIVRGARSEERYLHDGTNAFRRVPGQE